MTRRTPREEGPEPPPVPPDPWSERDGLWTIGDPAASAVAVVCCLHGDEPCGKRAVERVVTEHGDPEGVIEGVSFVLADPPAYVRGQRYVDEDLNRAFPGDPGAEGYERRQAARLLEALEGQLVLDVHSTVSSPTPFALVGSRVERVRAAARNTGVGRVVDVGYVDGGLIGELDGVAVEVDGSDPERGTDDAARTVAGFLANYGLVDAERRRSDPVVYRVDGEIAKGSGEFELLHGNFERVGDGEPLARREGRVLAAAGAFYPVLTSETGYDRIYGFRAEREGRLSELTDERERADTARATGRSPTADP